MTAGDPAGFLLLLLFPLFAVVIYLAGRRRHRSTPSFHLLREIIDVLPLIPRSYFIRRRIQTVLLLGAVLALGLAAGGPILGNADSKPLRMVIVLDHLSVGNQPRSGGGTAEIAETAAAIIESLRGDDQIFLARTDTGALTEGYVSRRRALAVAKDQAPSELPLPMDAALNFLELLVASQRPDRSVVVTSFPGRWRTASGEGKPGWDIAATPSAPSGTNYAIVDVDLLPDLLTPDRFSLFCRAAAFSTGDVVPPLTATLSVTHDGRLIESRELSFGKDGMAGFLLEDFTASEGLLSLRLEPSDHFPQDNLFLTPLRSSPYLSAALVTTGNHPLEAALRALPGLSLSVREPGGETSGDAPAQVTVYDGYVPESLRGNSLVIAPSRSLPGLPVRGEVTYPARVSADGTNHLMEGVSFSSLRISRMPLIVAGQQLEVIARADGYPFFLAGDSIDGDRLGVIAFDPVKEWWVTDPSFPILITNLVSWLGSEARGRRSYFTVGERIKGVDLSHARAIVDPLGRRTGFADTDDGGYRFPLAGRYRIEGAGRDAGAEVFVNLLHEEVSRSLAVGETPETPPPPVAERPFRIEIRKLLIILALLMLLLEIPVAPARRVGRISR